MDKDLGIKIRKEQLKKLDDFVHGLYTELQTFKTYGIELKDIEALYLHIHDLIEELLSCNSTDEFMKKVEEFHKAVAGVLIIISPAKADAVKQEMKDSYQDFKADNFDDLLNNLQKTASQKYGSNAPQDQNDNPSDQEEEEEPDNDPDELVEQLGLKDHVKKKPKWESKEDPNPYPNQSKKPKWEEDTDEDADDPLADLLNEFENKEEN